MVAPNEGRSVAAQWGTQASSHTVRHCDPSIEQLWSQEDHVMLTPKTGQFCTFVLLYHYQMKKLHFY